MNSFKAKAKSFTYAVYRQDPPVFVGRDMKGVEVFRADLVNLGSVQGSHNQCWDQAVSLCNFPVLEKLSEEIVNVH